MSGVRGIWGAEENNRLFRNRVILNRLRGGACRKSAQAYETTSFGGVLRPPVTEGEEFPRRRTDAGRRLVKNKKTDLKRLRTGLPFFPPMLAAADAAVRREVRDD